MVCLPQETSNVLRVMMQNLAQIIPTAKPGLSLAFVVVVMARIVKCTIKKLHI